MLKDLINIVVAPGQTFQSIQEKPTILYPFLLLVLALSISQFFVFNLIDFEYFLDELAAQQAAAAQIPVSEIRQNMQFLSPNTLALMTTAGLVLGLSLGFCIYAAYLNLIAKLGDDRYSFRHFFSLTLWTYMPLLFSALVAILNVVLSSNRQFTQTQLDPLSLNNLLFHSSGPYATMLTSTNVIYIWSAVLMVLGYQHLTSSSLAKAATITLAPTVVIYGGWTLTIMLGS